MIARRHRNRVPLVATMLSAGLSGLAPMHALAAEAQVQPAPAAQATADSSSASPAGDIVVTARRRNERAQDVPIALTALSAAQVEQPGTVGLAQVAQLVPSLQITSTNPRNTYINIRGLGATPAFVSLGLEYGVGVYVDQVYYSRPTQAAFDLYDLSQVEVLRGPQGTLFGKNTTAGAITITTAEPSFRPEFKGELTLGNYQSVQARVNGSLPLTDTLAMRISLSDTVRRKGFETNLHNGTRLDDLDAQSARVQLLFKPDARFKLRLIGDYSTSYQNCCSGVDSAFRTTRVDGSPLPNNFFARAARFGYSPVPVDLSARQLDLNSPVNITITSKGVSLAGDYDLGPATITSVTAYRDLQYRPHTDGDVTGLAIFNDAGVNENQKQFSQELRIGSNRKGWLDYVAGLYYFGQRLDDTFFTIYGPDAALWILGPAAGSTQASAGGQAALNGAEALGTAFATTRSYAAFGEATAHAGPLDLTLGLRYTAERKHGAFAQMQEGPALTPAQVLLGAQAIRNSFAANVPQFLVSTREDKPSGRATIGYHPARDVLIYATYAQGFKSGGLNLNPTTAPKVIAPEKAQSWEAGLKSTLFARRMTLNLAAYRETINNYQSQEIDTSVAQTAYIANVGKVRSQGIEADATLRLASGINLFASGAYDDAKYVDYAQAPCPVEYLGLQTVCNLSGRALPGVSKFTWSAGLNAEHKLRDGGRLHFDADWSHRSSFYATYNLAADSLIPAYGIADARLGYGAASGRWEISVFARNIFNKTYITIINPSAFNTGQSTATLGTPRTYGVTMKVTL